MLFLQRTQNNHQEEKRKCAYIALSSSNRSRRFYFHYSSLFSLLFCLSSSQRNLQLFLHHTSSIYRMHERKLLLLGTCSTQLLRPAVWIVAHYHTISEVIFRVSCRYVSSFFVMFLPSAPSSLVNIWCMRKSTWPFSCWRSKTILVWI